MDISADCDGTFKWMLLGPAMKISSAWGRIVRCLIVIQFDVAFGDGLEFLKSFEVGFDIVQG